MRVSFTLTHCSWRQCCCCLIYFLEFTVTLFRINRKLFKWWFFFWKNVFWKTFSNTLSWEKIFVVFFNFSEVLLLRVKLTISQQWILALLDCATRLQWINEETSSLEMAVKILRHLAALKVTVAYCRHTTSWILVNIDSANGLLAPELVIN